MTDRSQPEHSPLLAGIELGGTKIIAVLGRGGNVHERQAFATTADPAATLAPVLNQITRWAADQPIAAIGIASFGPVALDPRSAHYGQILVTTKPGWAGFGVLAAVRAAIDMPVAIDTDVNAAALAEGRWGGSAGCRVHAYVTIGTGLGGGIVVDGHPLHGFMHPEIGHMRVPRVAGDGFAGACPFHGDCMEGLVAGPALAARTGLAGADIPGDHPVWENVAHELGDFFANMLASFAPERIALGGSVVLGRPSLLPAVRAVVSRRLAGYLLATGTAPQDRIVLATLGADAGPLGALALAETALG